MTKFILIVLAVCYVASVESASAISSLKLPNCPEIARPMCSMEEVRTKCPLECGQNPANPATSTAQPPQGSQEKASTTAAPALNAVAADKKSGASSANQHPGSAENHESSTASVSTAKPASGNDESSSAASTTHKAGSHESSTRQAASSSTKKPDSSSSTHHSGEHHDASTTQNPDSKPAGNDDDKDCDNGNHENNGKHLGNDGNNGHKKKCANKPLKKKCNKGNNGKHLGNDGNNGNNGDCEDDAKDKSHDKKSGEKKIGDKKSGQKKSGEKVLQTNNKPAQARKSKPQNHGSKEKAPAPTEDDKPAKKHLLQSSSAKPVTHKQHSGENHGHKIDHPIGQHVQPKPNHETGGHSAASREGSKEKKNDSKGNSGSQEKNGKLTTKHETKHTTRKPTTRGTQKKANNNKCNGVDPCVSKSKADNGFKARAAKMGLPDKCTSKHCHYDATFPEMKTAMMAKECPMGGIRTYLQAASNGKDNTACCQKQGVLEGKGASCAPFCNPSGNNWPPEGTPISKFMPCASQMNAILTCHWAGLREDENGDGNDGHED